MKTLFIILALLSLVACGGSESITVEDEDNLIAYEEAELECIVDGGEFITSTYEDLETGIITYEGYCQVSDCFYLDGEVEGMNGKQICGKSYK